MSVERTMKLRSSADEVLTDKVDNDKWKVSWFPLTCLFAFFALLLWKAGVVSVHEGKVLTTVTKKAFSCITYAVTMLAQDSLRLGCFCGGFHLLMISGSRDAAVVLKIGM